MADSSLADQVGPTWEQEHIPDSDLLFVRVHRNWIDEVGQVMPGFFRDPEMSSDWNKYSTPQETQQRAISSPVADNGVIQLSVGDVRGIPNQVVTHKPLPANRAHAEIQGEKKKHPEVRIGFLRVYQFLISPDP